MAWVQFNNGGTHDIGSSINDDVWVDYQAPGMQTTVNLIAGEGSSGSVSYPYRLKGFNDSRINVSGGYVHEFYANDNSQITLSSGEIYQLYISGNSQYTMSGGDMGGPTYEGSIYASDNSQITVSGGSVGMLSATDNNYITMSDGLVYQLVISGYSQTTISGGLVYGLGVGGNSHVTVSGGTIGSQLTLSGNGKVTIAGSDFAIDGTPFGFGGITSILGGLCDNEPYRVLTGTLANGDIINNQFQIGSSAVLNLIPVTPVPEPSSLLVLCGGVVGLLAFRRRRR